MVCEKVGGPKHPPLAQNSLKILRREVLGSHGFSKKFRILQFHHRLFQGSKTWKMLRCLCRFWRRLTFGKTQFFLVKKMVEDRDIETRDVEHVELVFLDEFWYGSINHSVKMGLQQFTSTEN